MAAPIINAPSTYTLTIGTSISLNQLFSISDPDGNPITSYTIFDYNGSSGSAQGYTSVNGQYLPQGQGIQVNAGVVSLSSLYIIAGTAISDDSVGFTATDSTGQSTTVYVMIQSRPANTRPVMFLTNGSAPVSTTVAASTLFTAVDNDSDAITQYKIWDSAGGGYFSLNGVQIASNQYVTFTDLSQLTYTGAGQIGVDDKFWISARDANGYGNEAMGIAHTIRAGNTLPTVTVADRHVTAGARIYLGDLFSSADPDGDAIFQVKFTTTGDSSRFGFAPNSYFSIYTPLTVSNSQLQTYQLIANTSPTGNFGAPDTITVSVNDGYGWTTPVSFRVTVRAANHAPVVISAGQAATSGANVAATSLINVNDSDGDAPVTYRFWDSAGGGRFTLNGVTQASGQNIDVAAANIANLAYVGGSQPGSETLYAQVYDGEAWSAWANWSQLTNRTTNVASVISAANKNATQSQWVKGAELGIVVTDGDGDTPTIYEITDANSGVNSARFWLAGGYQQGGTITVNASQWANFYIQGGTDTSVDALSVRVYDGYEWSNTASFNLTTRLPNRASVLSTTNTGAAVGQGVAITSLFSVTDADGDAPQAYRFWDSVGGGYLRFGGNPLASNLDTTVNAADVGSMEYVGGGAPGSESLYAQVFDGTVWSGWYGWSQATIRTTNAVSVVSAANKAVTQGAWVKGTDLGITVSDGDGDTPVTYVITDANSGANSARFWLAGTYQQGGTMTLNASQWAGFWMQGGADASTDALTIQVYDGYAWSNTASFNLVSRAPNRAPVVAGSGTGVTVSQSVAATSLINITDADGDSPTIYRFWDAAGGGYFSLNGATQGANQNIDVTAANIASLTYTGAATKGGELLYAQVYDGQAWSAWASWTQNTTRSTNTVSVISAANRNAGQNEWVRGTDLGIVISDADGDTPTIYEVTDGNGALGSAYLWQGSDKPQGQVLQMSAAEWANFYVRGGANVGTDALSVRVYDGMGWSNTVTFNLNTRAPNRAPVVAGSNTGVAIGQSAAATSLINVTDADADSPTIYRFYDAAGGGYFKLGSVVQGVGQNIDVSAANIANLTYMGGAAKGSETLWAQVYDGQAWSAWASWTQNTTRLTNTVSVITASNKNVTQNEWVRGSDLGILISDADGDTPTIYEVTDGNGTAGSGYLWQGSDKPQGQVLQMSATEWANFYVRGGANLGTDAISVRVYDGMGWSNTVTFNLNTRAPNRAPVVTAQNQALHVNETLNPLSFINVSDADGDAVVKYRFWVKGNTDSYFTLNGVKQAVNASIEVDASSMAAFRYFTGTDATATIAETLWVQVYDGTVWTDWKSWQSTSYLSLPSTVISGLRLNDDLRSAAGNSIVYGGAGGDWISAPNNTDMSVWFGGGGDDYYFVPAHDAIIVLDAFSAHGGGLGRVQTNMTLLSSPAGGAAIIDGRHLLIGNSDTNQYLILADWRDPAHQPEKITVDNVDYTFAQFAALVPSSLPQLSWADLGLIKAEVDSMLSTYDTRTANTAIWGGWFPGAGLSWFLENEKKGTRADDIIQPTFSDAFTYHAVLGGGGDDLLNVTGHGGGGFANPVLLIGGVGKDKYVIEEGASAMILSKDESSGDSLLFRDLDFTLNDLRFAVVDGRHLEIVATDGQDRLTGTSVMLIDWQTQAHQIGTFVFRSNGAYSDHYTPVLASYSYADFVSFVNSRQVTSLAWEDIGISTTAANQVIDHYSVADSNLHAPVVVLRGTHTFSRIPGESVRVGSIATGHDGDGDEITKYQYRPTGASHGSFVSGSTILPDASVFEFSAAQAEVTYLSPASASESWEVRAYDGGKWSDWDAFSIVANASLPIDDPYHANPYTPTATPQAVSEWVGQNDPIDGYEFTIGAGGTLNLDFSGLNDRIGFSMKRTTGGWTDVTPVSITGGVAAESSGYQALGMQGGSVTYGVTAGSYLLQVVPVGAGNTHYQLAFSVT